MPASDNTLLLLAHGSTESANADLVELAQALDEKSIFSDVRAAFLKGAPDMRLALDALTTKKVIALPFMTSEGYFLRKVVPKALRENKSFESRDIRFAKVFGASAALPKLVQKNVASLFESRAIKKADTTLIVVGHGTRKNTTSAETCFSLVKALQTLEPALEVRAAFIDQEPTMLEVKRSIKTRHFIVVPFLMSRGPHATVDVPEAFGFEESLGGDGWVLSTLGGGVGICTKPVGLMQGVSEIVLSLAHDAL